MKIVEAGNVKKMYDKSFEASGLEINRNHAFDSHELILTLSVTKRVSYRNYTN